MDSERSPEARELAERALVWIIHELGERCEGIVVLGGLVPATLVEKSSTVPQHLGTTDVDVHIDFGVSLGSHLVAVERALVRLGFSPTQDGWRWTGPVSGTSVRIEFLCELDDQAAGVTVRPPGCDRLCAVNLRGTGFVTQDYVLRRVAGVLPSGREVTVELAFANIGGFLLAKAVALRERAEEKDYYDFTYVLLFNRLGGPAGAARWIREQGLSLPKANVWAEVEARFHDSNSSGPRGYASQARQVSPEADPAVLKQDALSAVQEFLWELGVARRTSGD
ncbi:MAG: hypothetical protein V2A76_08690 [Planctomycetota bacterium]